jgi:hypothetical protein
VNSNRELNRDFPVPFFRCIPLVSFFFSFAADNYMKSGIFAATWAIISIAFSRERGSIIGIALFWRWGEVFACFFRDDCLRGLDSRHRVTDVTVSPLFQNPFKNQKNHS